MCVVCVKGHCAVMYGGTAHCSFSMPVSKFIGKITTTDTEGFQSAAASVMEGHYPPSSLTPAPIFTILQLLHNNDKVCIRGLACESSHCQLLFGVFQIANDGGRI